MDPRCDSIGLFFGQKARANVRSRGLPPSGCIGGSRDALHPNNPSIAARHPEVLQYVPCYCGCERMGHNGNHECFVKSRKPNGTVTEWEPHGIGCAICLDVGRDAMTLFNSGTAVPQIRAGIERKYASHFPSSTPTPKP